MKFALPANFIIVVILFTNSVVRDLGYQKEGAGDLRNRVVGARLTKDGKDPYFYKWKTGDSFRYLDYANLTSDTVSTITATPLFHHLMSPLSDYPQRTIACTWFVFEYLALLIITGAGVLICRTKVQKIVVLNTGVLFTYTHAWMLHILVGQIYIFIAALLMLVALFIIKQNDRRHASIIEAVLTVILIFIRPVSSVILLPFIFSLKKHRPYLIATFLFSLAYLTFVFTNQNEKKQWTNYSRAMAEQVKVHQDLNHATVKVERPPVLANFEGLNPEKQKKAAIEHPFPDYSENGNVFFVYKTLLHAKMHLGVLYALYVCAVLFLMVLFWKKYKKTGLNDRDTLLFAFVLYMVTELFTPVHRHQYNSVQWLPLILLAISMHKRLLSFPYLLMFTGIILNISKIEFIPIRHTIGEYLLLLSLLLILLGNKTEENTYG